METDSNSKPLVFGDKYKIKWYQNPRLLRYVFSIVLITILVSMFELAFVRYISVPETDKAVNQLFPALPEDPPIFRQVEIAEKSDRSQKNNYLIFNFSLVIVVLLFLLYYIYLKMKEDQARVPVFGHNFRATILQSVFSVLVLASFQLFFFQFVQKSALSSEKEIQLAVTKGILDGINAELEKR